MCGVLIQGSHQVALLIARFSSFGLEGKEEEGRGRGDPGLSMPQRTTKRFRPVAEQSRVWLYCFHLQ